MFAGQDVPVVGRQAVRPVERNRVRDAGVQEGQRVEHALGEEDLVRGARRLDVQHPAQRPGQVAVPVRPHAPAVERRPGAGHRVRNRHDQAAAEEFAALGRQYPERLQVLADRPAARQPRPQRPVRIPHLEGPQQRPVGQAAPPQIRLRIRSGAEGAVVVRHHPREHRARRQRGLGGRRGCRHCGLRTGAAAGDRERSLSSSIARPARSASRRTAS